MINNDKDDDTLRKYKVKRNKKKHPDLDLTLEPGLKSYQF